MSSHTLAPPSCAGRPPPGSRASLHITDTTRLTLLDPATARRMTAPHGTGTTRSLSSFEGACRNARTNEESCHSARSEAELQNPVATNVRLWDCGVDSRNCKMSHRIFFHITDTARLTLLDPATTRRMTVFHDTGTTRAHRQGLRPTQ